MELQKSTEKFNELVGKSSTFRWTAMQSMYGALAETIKHHSILIPNLGVTIDMEQEAFRETVFKAFKYSKKELLVLDDLLTKRNRASQLFYKSYFDLEQKKDKALNSPNLGGPGVFDSETLKIPKEELLKNKLVTKTLMYHEENNKLKDM